MTGGPRVTVLVPAFNAAATLPRAIRSVLGQTLDDLELIVIDDASTDATLATAQALAATDRRVRVLQAPRNGGPGAARSLGLSDALGSWIAILDADDLFRPERLARLLLLAEQHRLDAVADNLQLLDAGAGRVVGLALPLEPDALEIFDPARFLANTIPAGRVNIGWTQPMIRRDFLQHHGIAWRDLRHAEDLVFAMEVLLAGARFAVSGYAGYIYTQRRGTVSGAPSPHSRTHRSVSEQKRALEELERRCAIALTPSLRRRLAAMRPEIEVASRLLDARDRVSDRRIMAAAASIIAAMLSPRALASCLMARYGPRAGRLA
jgi:succinoglycan biosynthesis protein ExoO